MAIVVSWDRAASGKHVVSVAGEDLSRPQLTVALGMENSPELHKALDLVATARQYASTHRFASARETGRQG